MKLLIDLGNSRCKYALLQQDGSIDYVAQNYGPFGKLYTVKSLCDKYEDAEKIVISSVLSENMNNEIKQTIVDKDKRNVFYLNPGANPFGVTLAYKDSNAIGVDRVAAMIATKESYSGKSCVIDCGTAITIDSIDADGLHHGGVILPGIKIMQTALLSNTKIDSGKVEEVFNIFADTTETAIHSGSVSAVLGGIRFVIEQMTSQTEKFDQAVMTGGGAEYINDFLVSSGSSLQLHIDENLVLNGLRLVAENI